MRRSGAVGLALAAVLALVAGGIGYDLGVRHATELAIAGGANVTYVVNAGGGGFPFFGLLFGLVVFGLFMGFIRRAMWGARHGWDRMHGPRPGGWGGPTSAPPTGPGTAP